MLHWDFVASGHVVRIKVDSLKTKLYFSNGLFVSQTSIKNDICTLKS